VLLHESCGPALPAASGRCDVVTSTGRYSCIAATFLLRHQAASQVAATMVPCVMWVAVAWLGLCLPGDRLLPRLLLSGLRWQGAGQGIMSPAASTACP
jgi:hypothetical protein